MPREAASALRRDRNGFVRCRVCGCTEIDACHPPCSWADPTLCSGCQEAVDALVEWKLGARRANQAALLREVSAQIGQPQIGDGV